MNFPHEPIWAMRFKISENFNKFLLKNKRIDAVGTQDPSETITQ